MPNLPQTHPLRESLIGELHARPFELLRPPERISRLTLLSGEHGIAAERAHLAGLCGRFGRPPPASDAAFFSADLGSFRLRWERHTEFSTYTVFVHGANGEPFADPAVRALPKDWLAAIPGELLGAVHVEFESRDSTKRAPEELAGLFGGRTVAGSRIAGGAALAWSDFRLHEDGFGRILVRDATMSERQAGRMIQRLLEIDAYRQLALLALPLARAASPRVQKVDEGLAEIAGQLARPPEAERPADAELLTRLSRLAAEIEQVTASTSYRFGASRAYHDLVDQRLAELRQERIEGVQTFGEFMERRFGPAMATCRSTEARQEALSQRAARVAGLLRARVEVEQERQNQALLDSMNRRAALQLRLQETVEGLSVVAIGYYLVGLVGYGLKGLKSFGAPLDLDIAVALSVPVVLGLVYLGLRRFRRRLHKPE